LAAPRRAPPNVPAKRVRKLFTNSGYAAV
jgi:hypothetical protein